MQPDTKAKAKPKGKPVRGKCLGKLQGPSDSDLTLRLVCWIAACCQNSLQKGYRLRPSPKPMEWGTQHFAMAMDGLGILLEKMVFNLMFFQLKSAEVR